MKRDDREFWETFNSLSDKGKRKAYYILCFFLWQSGQRKKAQINLFQILLGGWFHYTWPLDKAISDLKSISIEERGLLVAGFMIGLLYVLMLVAKVG